MKKMRNKWVLALVFMGLLSQAGSGLLYAAAGQETKQETEQEEQKEEQSRLASAATKVKTLATTGFKAFMNRMGYNEPILPFRVQAEAPYGLQPLSIFYDYNLGFSGAGDLLEVATQGFPHLTLGKGIDEGDEVVKLNDFVIDYIAKLVALIPGVSQSQVKSVMNELKDITPTKIFWLRTIGLFMTVARNRNEHPDHFPTAGDIGPELLKLAYRLTISKNPATKKPYGFKVLPKLVTQFLPSPVKQALDGLKWGDKALLDWIDFFLGQLDTLANYKFQGDLEWNPQTYGRTDKYGKGKRVQILIARLAAIAYRALTQHVFVAHIGLKDDKGKVIIQGFKDGEGKDLYEKYETASENFRQGKDATGRAFTAYAERDQTEDEQVQAIVKAQQDAWQERKKRFKAYFNALLNYKIQLHQNTPVGWMPLVKRSYYDRPEWKPDKTPPLIPDPVKDFSKLKLSIRSWIILELARTFVMDKAAWGSPPVKAAAPIIFTLILGIDYKQLQKEVDTAVGCEVIGGEVVQPTTAPPAVEPPSMTSTVINPAQEMTDKNWADAYADAEDDETEEQDEFGKDVEKTEQQKIFEAQSDAAW